MTYPGDERRRRDRHVLQRDVQIAVGPFSAEFQTVSLLDLSQQGAAITPPQPLPSAADTVVLLLPDPHEEGVQREIIAQVVYASEDKVGLRFETLTVETMTCVLELMEQAGEE
jgi:hypothetical protein